MISTFGEELPPFSFMLFFYQARIMDLEDREDIEDYSALFYYPMKKKAVCVLPLPSYSYLIFL